MNLIELSSVLTRLHFSDFDSDKTRNIIKHFYSLLRYFSWFKNYKLRQFETFYKYFIRYLTFLLTFSLRGTKNWEELRIVYLLYKNSQVVPGHAVLYYQVVFPLLYIPELHLFTLKNTKLTSLLKQHRDMQRVAWIFFCETVLLQFDLDFINHWGQLKKILPP